MSVTEDTSQFPMSSLKVVLALKSSLILVTPAPKHQSPIGPYCAAMDACDCELETQLLTALLSCLLVWIQVNVGGGVVG
jgi:hypothetical protein